MSSKGRVIAAGSELEAYTLEERGRFEGGSCSRYVQIRNILMIMAGNWKCFMAGNWKSSFVVPIVIPNSRTFPVGIYKA